jgi:hypothetical protein
MLKNDVCSSGQDANDTHRLMPTHDDQITDTGLGEACVGSVQNVCEWFTRCRVILNPFCTIFWASDPGHPGHQKGPFIVSSPCSFPSVLHLLHWVKSGISPFLWSLKELGGNRFTVLVKIAVCVSFIFF